MTHPADTSDDIAHEAAEWVIRHDRGLSVAEAAAFKAWIVGRPQREEFTRIAAKWKSLDRLAPAPVLSAAADAIVFRAQARQQRRHRVTVMAGGLLAAAAALAMGYYLWFRPTSVPASPPALTLAGNYRVIAGTSHEIRLPDGSIATLNGDSRIETHYTPDERRVRLVRGEALFAVAKNPDRPFYVSAGPITVRAVGTAFNVRMGASAVEVLVTEGKVRVDDSARGVSLLPPASDGAHGAPDREEVLTAGQRVVVNLAAVIDASSQARVAAVGPAEIERSLAWQSTQLVFDDTSLDEVVGAFNRYNRRQLVIGDRVLGRHKITGVFRADNPDGFARLLGTGNDVKTETRGEDEMVLHTGR